MRHPSEWNACACGRPKLIRARTCRVCWSPFAAAEGPLAVRFWARVDQSGGPDACWPWASHQASKGYGNFNNQLTHRIAWQLARGPIPEGLFVCHTCDNPPCCSPAHLFLGTNQDNMRDASRKGRLRASRHTAKLSEDHVLRIRSEARAGLTHRLIAERHEVTPRTIVRVLNGESWSWVVEEPVQMGMGMAS